MLRRDVSVAVPVGSVGEHGGDEASEHEGLLIAPSNDHAILV